MTEPIHPGVILKDSLALQSIKQNQMATALRISGKHLSQVINGHVPISPMLAVKLSRVLGTWPEYWINLQTAFDIHEAEIKLKGWRPLKGEPVNGN